MALLTLGIIWTLFGIFAYKGYKAIQVPTEYENKEWTNQYKRKYSISYFLIGVPYILFYIFIECTNYEIGILGSDAMIVVLAIPALIYGAFLDHKFKDKI